jgi:hypothetical protein
LCDYFPAFICNDDATIRDGVLDLTEEAKYGKPATRRRRKVACCDAIHDILERNRTSGLARDVFARERHLDAWPYRIQAS